MRNTRLSNLKRKTSSVFNDLYLKKYYKTARLKNYYTEDVKEYLTRQAFDILPSYAKAVLESDKEKYIQNILAISRAEDNPKGISPYKALIGNAKSLSGRSLNAIRFYSMFRNEAHSVYAKYNSYMYRNGFSASVYFYSNAEYSSRGKTVDITVELPKLIGNIKKYDILTISIDVSAGIVLSAEMK